MSVFPPWLGGENRKRELGVNKRDKTLGTFGDQFSDYDQLWLPNSPLSEALAVCVALLVADIARAERNSELAAMIQKQKDLTFKLFMNKLKLTEAEKREHQKDRREEELKAEGKEIEIQLAEIHNRPKVQNLVSPSWLAEHRRVMDFLHSPEARQVVQLDPRDVENFTAKSVDMIIDFTKRVVDAAGGDINKAVEHINSENRVLIDQKLQFQAEGNTEGAQKMTEKLEENQKIIAHVAKLGVLEELKERINPAKPRYEDSEDNSSPSPT